MPLPLKQCTQTSVVVLQEQENRGGKKEMNPLRRCQQPAISITLAGNTRQKSGGKGRREWLVE